MQQADALHKPISIYFLRHIFVTYNTPSYVNVPRYKLCAPRAFLFVSRTTSTIQTLAITSHSSSLTSSFLQNTKNFKLKLGSLRDVHTIRSIQLWCCSNRSCRCCYSALLESTSSSSYRKSMSKSSTVRVVFLTIHTAIDR